MKSFQEFINEDNEEYNLQDIVNEANYVSQHRRTPTQMATIHKSILQKAGHTILNHETTGDGSHVIHHLTPRKTVRVTTIKPVKSGSNNTHMQDRPGSTEEKEKYAPKN